MGNSSSKVPEYEVVVQDRQQQQQQGASASNSNRRSTLGSFSPPSQGLLQQPPPSSSAASSSSNAQQWAPVQAAPPPPLPQGWDFHIDPSSGYPYFFNTMAGVSQWQDPRGSGFALPDRSEVTHLGQRRQVIPPWEGGPADVDPLSWPLPPGWYEQQDQATGQRYFVNYDARILSYNDPRVEIAKAYRNGGTVAGIPVNYPPPVIGRPVDEPNPVWPLDQQPPTGFGGQTAPGGTSSLPPPPPSSNKKRSVWYKLGYRQGRGRWGLFAGASAAYLYDNSELPEGEERSNSSTSSSSDDQDNEDNEWIDVNAGADADTDFNFGGNWSGNYDGSGESDRRAMDQYGSHNLPESGESQLGGREGENQGGDGGSYVGNVYYQQSSFGSWQTSGKDVYFPGWDEALDVHLNGREFWTLDKYTKFALVLTVLVGSYFGVIKGVLSFVLAFSARLIVLMYKRARILKYQCRRSSRRFCEKVRWVVKRKDSLVLLKTAAVSQCVHIQAWFFEHLYEHPIVKLRMLTEKDNAPPLFSRLLPQPREITIVTQASADRLPAIEAMARSWGGVMCVAVHIRTTAELQEIYPRLCSLHEQIEALGHCRLHIGVVREEGLSSDKEAMTALYPINAMRNIALSMATTELVFILDADFVPSIGMHESLTGDETLYSEMLRMATAEDRMLVVPAFEGMPAQGVDLNVSHMTYPKTMCDLREKWKDGSAKAFHCSHFPRGHEPTDYKRFFSVLTSEPYTVRYREFYEPYVICAREAIPSFDARFRGYGLNKISHAYQCAAKGMHFCVLPRVFVWSLPHRKSEAWSYTFGACKDPLQKLRILGLYRQFKSEVQVLYKYKTLESANPEVIEIKVDILPGQCAKWNAPTGAVVKHLLLE